MTVFVTVAEAGGFAAAARRLGLSPPAVTRAVADLERRLGARLFHRTTRSVHLTQAGERFRADCRRILADMAAAEAAAGGAHGEVVGRLAVTAPVLFGRLFVAPLVLEFLAGHPRVAVEALYVDRVVNLVEEGFDVAVRIAPLPDSGLRAIRVGAVRRVVCASPDYLARHGHPRTPAEIADRDAVVFNAEGEGGAWAFQVDGRRVAATPRARLTVNTADVAVAAAVAGWGLTRVLSYQVASAVAAGTLRVVLADAEPPPIPIHVVHKEGALPAARVRAFVDFAAAGLARALARA